MVNLNSIALISSPIRAALLAAGANPLCVEFVLHYIVGTQEEKTLPGSAIRELSPHLCRVLKGHLLGERRYESCIASMPHNCKGDSWWNTLWGVVGQYRWEIASYDSKGFHIKCWDLWDFNISGSSAQIKIPIPKGMEKVVKPLAKKLGVVCSISDGYLEVEETQLTKFNEEHQFLTKWDAFISWEDLGLDSSRYIQAKEEPEYQHHLIIKEGYCLPKWKEQEIALSKRGLEVDLSPEVYGFWSNTTLEHLWSSLEEVPKTPIDWEYWEGVAKDYPEGSLSHEDQEKSGEVLACIFLDYVETGPTGQRKVVRRRLGYHRY